MSISSHAELETIRIALDKEQYIPFGANLTTGSLQSGEWSSSKTSVAQITSQSAVGCYVKGVSTGTATISCKSSFSLLRIRKTKSGNIPVASAGRKPLLSILNQWCC